MPILVQEVVNRGLSALDAEGSERYLFDQDFKPAINYANEWMVAAINKILGGTKLSGEALRELVKIKVFQANSYSRIAFNEATVGHKLWSILALYPEPVVAPFQQPVPDPNPAVSKYMPGLSHVSGKSCTNRMNLEEWNDNQKNVFSPGNTSLLGELNEYAYLDFGDYSSSTYTDPGTFEIEVRPSVANQFISLAYVKKPNLITLITDSIEFPETMLDIVLEKMLQFISFKQGDHTTLYIVTDKDIARLMPYMQ